MTPHTPSSADALGEDPTNSLLQGSAPHLRNNQYAQLKRLIKDNGLLDKQTGYYAGKITLTLGLLALNLTFLLILDTLWLQLLNAAFLAFVFVQISLVGHDLGHRQFSLGVGWKDEGLALFLGNLLIGISRQWWIGKHNEHHSHPNQLDVDPDVDIVLVAFSEEQALSKQGIARLVVKYQAYLLFPLSLLQALSMNFSSIQFLVERKAKHTLAEAISLGAHFVVYFGLLFSLLGAWQAVVFIIIHKGLTGLYLTSIFAPNHKGMPILSKDRQMDFLHRQVLSSRNVSAHWLTDFCYGGLNYQIEHHLFPSMPRNKLREAQAIVKPFCEEHSIAYHETSVLQSYREILQCLHWAGAPIREARKAR